ADRRRGGRVAARGTCTAARPDAAHRRAHELGRERSGRAGPRRSVPAGAAAIGLDRRPQRADRHPPDPGRYRPRPQRRGGIGRARAGRHPDHWQRGCGGVAPGDPHRADRVGAGYVDSLARPGGNATGFTSFEYGISAKWLELLKQIAPRLGRVAILRDTTIAVGTGQYGAIQSVAPSFLVELSPLNVRDA